LIAPAGLAKHGWPEAGHGRQPALLDEDLVIAIQNGAIASTGFSHPAAKQCELRVGIHYVPFDGLAGFWIKSTIV
jgi:hypothetical protein